ncbi:MAG: hypothetical protein F6K56_38755 [Moorea sp. SIO3G5]|nr:hypothetical protein [Moorena sp. SIO3G5]
MWDTGANGEMTWVTEAKVLKKCLRIDPQSDQHMRESIPDYPHSVFDLIAVISEEGRGKVDCPKSSQQSDEWNK